MNGTDPEKWISCCHTVRVLRKAGIESMEQLSRLSDEEILRIRGIGPVIHRDLVKIITAWREQSGTFAGHQLVPVSQG